MASSYTTNLGLTLPTTGELAGTWGDVVNVGITALLDSAIAGTVTLSADADVTLSTTNGAANQARSAVILWTASNGATTRNVTAPAHTKAYIVINTGTGSVVIRGVGPTTGVTVTAGTQVVVAWNGTDFVVCGQPLLVSGTNIKSINSNSLLGAGDLPVQATLVSGTNIKSINSNSILGSGDLLIDTAVQTHAATSKATPVDADEIPLADSAASWGLKKLTWANIKATFIGTVNSWTKAQIGTPVALSISANAVAVDLSLGNNFTLTLQATTSQALSNPTNAVAGQSGNITITQNATSSPLTYGTNWKPVDGNAASVSTTASAVNVWSYYVVDSTHIWFQLNKNGAT